MKMNEYKAFLQQCSKSELLSFIKNYETSMNRRKKFISLEDYFIEKQEQRFKQLEEGAKKIAEITQNVGAKVRDPFKEVSK